MSAFDDRLFFETVLITTKTTTQVKTGPGYFKSIQVQKAGSTDTIDIYDDVDSGTSNHIGSFSAATVNEYMYERSFTNGLKIVTGGGTAGNYMVRYK